MLYSFGVVLFEMVTGQLPYARASLKESEQCAPEPPSSPRSLVPDLACEWEAGILPCLQADASKRPHSAAAVLQRIRSRHATRRRWFANENIIQAAIEGFEAQKQRLDEQIAELRGMLSGASSESVSVSPPNGRGTMSAASRKRIADAMRKRWAAVKKDGVPETAAPAPKKAKRHLSPEGRRRIIEATKKRWAAVRAAAGKRGK